MDRHVVDVIADSSQRVRHRIGSLGATIDNFHSKNRDVRAEFAEERLPIFRGDHDQDLFYVASIQETIDCVQPHSAVFQRRERLLVMLVPKSAALASSR